jgi:hypothetical protein
MPGSSEAHNRRAVLGLGPTEEALSSDDMAAAAAKLRIAGIAAPTLGFKCQPEKQQLRWLRLGVDGG